MDGRRFLRTRAAAEYLGIAARTLEDLRLRGGGPTYSTPRARIVLYDVRDLEAWIALGRRTSTSNTGGAPDRAS